MTVQLIKIVYIEYVLPVASIKYPTEIDKIVTATAFIATNTVIAVD
jgi:hypothetical protein